MALILKITSPDKDGRHWKPRTLLVGMQKSSGTVENSVGVPPKVKQNITWSSNSTPGYVLQRTDNRYSHTHKGSWQHHSQQLKSRNNSNVHDGWGDERHVSYTHTDQFPVTNMTDTLSHAAQRTDFESTVLSDSQTQNVTHTVWFHLYADRQVRRDGKQTGGGQGWGGKDWGVTT